MGSGECGERPRMRWFFIVAVGVSGGVGSGFSGERGVCR